MNTSYTEYWTNRVNKLSLNKSVSIPDYGTVTCYKAADGEYGSRRFKLTKVQNYAFSAGGNRTLAQIRADLDA